MVGRLPYGAVNVKENLNLWRPASGNIFAWAKVAERSVLLTCVREVFPFRAVTNTGSEMPGTDRQSLCHKLAETLSAGFFLRRRVTLHERRSVGWRSTTPGLSTTRKLSWIATRG